VRKVTWALLGIAVGGLVGSLLLGVVIAAQIRNAQVERQPQLQADSETLSIIKSCTEPTGECYKRGQKQTARVLSDVSRIIILAAACAVDVTPAETVADRQLSIQNCISDRIADDR
jgi:hypothetical protein